MIIKKLLPILILFSCSNELRVYHDFDPGISIQVLTNYAWLPAKQIESRNNPIVYNELVDKRIKTAVDNQLKEKGYIRSDSSEQMIVHYHIVIENKTSIRSEPFGYNYGRYWLQNELDSYRYEEGTLIVDFMDSRNCDLIWRGWAVAVLDTDVINEELISKAVAEIFKTFPISAAKEVTLP